MQILIKFLTIFSWIILFGTSIAYLVNKDNPFVETDYNKALVAIIWLIVVYFSK